MLLADGVLLIGIVLGLIVGLRVSACHLRGRQEGFRNDQIHRTPHPAHRYRRPDRRLIAVQFFLPISGATVQLEEAGLGALIAGCRPSSATISRIEP